MMMGVAIPGDWALGQIGRTPLWTDSFEDAEGWTQVTAQSETWTRVTAQSETWTEV